MNKRAAGFVSIPAIAFLIVAIFFILSQTLGILGNRAGDSILIHRSMSALMVAESGVEYAAGWLDTSTNEKSKNFETVCVGLPGMGPYQFDQGFVYFETPVPYFDPFLDSPYVKVQGDEFCKVRVRAVLQDVQRVVDVVFFLDKLGNTYLVRPRAWHELASDEAGWSRRP